MNADAFAPSDRQTSGVTVNSRRELVEYLREFPLKLRAARPSPPPRVGHPDFVGAVQPEVLNRVSAIQFVAGGHAFFGLQKRREDERRDAALLAWGIEL